MKRLYIILLVLFIAACAGPKSQEIELSAGQLQPTIPPEWLTKPPTPVVSPTSLAIPQASVSNPLATPTLRAGAEEPTATADQQMNILPSPTATTTPFIAPTAVLRRRLTLSAAPDVPAQLAGSVRQLAATMPNDFQWVEPDEGKADITLQIGNGTPMTQWVYVVAAPFATVKDEITFDEVLALWSAASLGDESLVISENTVAVLSNLLGPPGSGVVQVNEDNLHDTLWDSRPSITIVPFDELTPDLKALRLDGNSLLNPAVAPEDYPLVLAVEVSGEEQALAEFLPFWSMPSTNRDTGKMTRVAMTGVTALVRATATQMEIDGILTAGTDVAPVLRAVDIAHISNEVSFAEDCPEPNPIGGTTFCSQDEYFALLEDLGTDVIELTGNHVNDWGPEAVLHTLEMYEDANMRFFGGGRDREESAKPAIFQHKGNRIAFVGCNPVGPNYAWAGPSNPGSQPCGPEFIEQIEQLSAQGYLVIATQQYYEFYHYPPTPQQQEDFKELVDAGAAAVSGSQGHHAQGFEMYNGAFVHYGLGNLFFDQMDMMGTRQSFVDIYTIYDGRLLNVELWTGLIEDYFQPRLMTAEEREDLLQTIFEASGW